MTGWHVQAVANEVNSRVRNEWIQRANDSADDLEPLREFVCECSDDHCPSVISLSSQEYEAIRTEGTYFAIASNHENPEVDWVIREAERFTVVQKGLGPLRAIASESDPRA